MKLKIEIALNKIATRIELGVNFKTLGQFLNHGSLVHVKFVIYGKISTINKNCEFGSHEFSSIFIDTNTCEPNFCETLMS